jgi:hypothetical protein
MLLRMLIYCYKSVTICPFIIPCVQFPHFSSRKVQYVNILRVSYVRIKYNHMPYLEVTCNLVLTFRSEIVKVPFIDFVLNLEIAVYCTHWLHTLYLVSFSSRLNYKLLSSIISIILDLVIEIVLEVAPLPLLNINKSIEWSHSFSVKSHQPYI